MPRARMNVRQIRKLLALTFESRLGLRDVARLTGVSKTTISEYLVRFHRTGISYEESLELTALFPEYAKRLKQRGMTKQFLWEEYRKKQPDGYRYSQFCHHFGVFLDSGELPSLLEYARPIVAARMDNSPTVATRRLRYYSSILSLVVGGAA